MAYVSQTEEQKKDQENQQQVSSETVPKMTSAAPSSGPATGKGTSSANPNQTPGQPFTNINAYLAANAPQIAQQGETVAGNLTSQYGQLKSDIEKGTQDFNAQVAAGYQAPDTNIVNEAVTNPTEFVKDPNKVKAFQSQFNTDYSGPDAFETTDTYGKLSGDVSRGVENASLVNTIPGLQTYLRNTGPSTATKGQNVLDTVLLQGSPEAYSKVTEASKPFNTLQEYLGTNTATANKAVQDAMAADQAQATAVQDKFVGEKGILPEFQKGFDTRLQEAQTKGIETQNLGNKFLEYLKGTATMTPEELQKIGLEPGQIQTSMNTINEVKAYGGNPDLTGYVNMEAPNISRESFASPQDYAEAVALAKLTGQDLGSFLNPESANLAGTYNPGKVNFDQAGAGDDILKQKLDLASKVPKNPYVYNPNSNLKFENGQMMWRDQNNQWVPAPTEFKNENGRNYKFNYGTGQYEDQGPATPSVGPSFKAF